MQAPFIPQFAGGETDVSHFDNQFTKMSLDMTPVDNRFTEFYADQVQFSNFSYVHNDVK